MSGWTEIEEGSIKTIHHSTSSLVEIQITSKVEYEQGKWRVETHSTWLDYGELDDLKKVLNQIDT